MRLSLEQLKAMSNAELFTVWTAAQFPFDRAGCEHCLTQHAAGMCESHQDLISKTLSDPLSLRENLEELYALRLFYDHLYPQPTEAQAEQDAKEVLQREIEFTRAEISYWDSRSGS